MKSMVSKSFLAPVESLKMLKDKARQDCMSESDLIRKGISIALKKSILVKKTKIREKYKHAKFKNPMILKHFLISDILLKQVGKEASRRKESESAFFRWAIRTILAEGQQKAIQPVKT